VSDCQADRRLIEQIKFKKPPPRLLCAVVTNIKLKKRPNQPHKEVVIASSKWVKTMRNLFASDLPSQSVKNIFYPSGKGTDDEQMVVVLAGEFNKLQQISHERGIPVAMMDVETLKGLKKDANGAYDGLFSRTPETEAAISHRVYTSFLSLARYIMNAPKGS
jgi:hypothetical protein